MSSRYLLVAAAALCAAVAWAQPETGRVAGTIYDAQSGRPLPNVVISVDGNIDLANVTDSDGNFTLTVAAGNHTLGFSAEGYRPAELTGVIVVAGEVAEASTLMAHEGVRESITVTETLDAVTATAAALLTERKLASVVSDSVGREELSQSSAGDAAGALEKVTGVTVGDEGHVFVRGLGERYSATSLNGAMVPTTEPEKRVVPLDLFPTGMIDNIKIAKTYSADLPAEFSGGLVQLETTQFPPRRTLSVSIKGGFNSNTTFSPFLTYPGSSGDYWGFGAGARGIPSAIPTDQRVTQGVFSQQELQTLGRSFSDVWEPTSVTSQQPGLGWSVNGGGTVGKLGLVGALSFSNRPQYTSELQRYIRQGGDQPIIFTDYPDFREYTETARLGGVFNVAYKPIANHRFLFRNTFTHDSDKVAREFSGYDGTLGSPVASQRLRYIARDVFSTGVDGEHVMPDWHNSVVHWQFTYSLSGRDEPDLREVFRTIGSDDRQKFAATSGSATRFFSYMNDKIYEPQVDYSIPFFAGNVSAFLKTGFRATIRRRDFQARRFRFIPQRLTTLNLYEPSDQLLGTENIRPDGFQLVEFTRGTDAYDASMDIYAGYLMLDLSLGPRWRVVGGIRVEDANQEVVTLDNQITTATPAIAKLQNRDPVPSLNIIYAATARQNIRISYSRTLSRPDFRELSPFDFNNVLGGFVTVGNPDLKRAAINNYDVRWELFPGGNQLIAASVFVKTFTDPIEQTVIVSNDLRQSFINAKGARNFGFELEFRQDMGRFNPLLNEFSLNANFTFVDSNVEIRPENAQLLTSRSRPLLGQARYVFNGALQWTRPRWNSDARLFANYVSRKISDLGTYGVPDIYQEANTSLDFVYQYTMGERGQWSYRFEAENLTNNYFHWTQGPFTQRLYQLGRTFQVGVNYSFF